MNITLAMGAQAANVVLIIIVAVVVVVLASRWMEHHTSGDCSRARDWCYKVGYNPQAYVQCFEVATKGPCAPREARRGPGDWLTTGVIVVGIVAMLGVVAAVVSR